MSNHQHHPPHPAENDPHSDIVDDVVVALAPGYLESAPEEDDDEPHAVYPPTANNKWSHNGFGAPVGATASGKFSPHESEIVRNAIAEYCAAKQISVARLCSEHEHKSELKGAWMEIARHLPERSVQSVYRHGIRRCHPFQRGAWSEEECRTLGELVNTVGKKWAVIQNKLNRSADSCRDKVGLWICSRYRSFVRSLTHGGFTM